MDIFCKIVNNELPSYTLYEDDIVKVFLDVNPNHNGHTLIVPKKHYQDFFDIDDETLYHVLKVAKDLGQEVKHFHLHLIPRYNNEKKIPVEEIYNILK